MENVTETQKTGRKLWQRILAMICVVALIVSMFSFLTQVKISPEDGIGADILAENNPYVDASASERLSYAAVSYLMLGERFQRSYQQASYFIGRGEYEKALVYLESCIAQSRENTDPAILDDLWLKYSCVQAVLGDYEKALEGFEKLSDGTAFAPEKEIVSAQIALEKGQMDMAYEHLGTYLTLSPEDTSVYGLYADCSYYNGEHQKAVQWYQKAADAGVTLDASEYMLWCMCLMDLGDAQTALEMAQKAMELGYSDVSLCYSQCAICYYMMGQFPQVLEYGARAMEYSSESVDYGMLIYYMGLATFGLDEYEAALQYLNTAAEMGCQEGELWFYRGFCKMLLEDPNGAIEDFTKSLDVEDLHYNSSLYRGISRLQTGDAQGARADLEEAVKSPDETIAAAAQDVLTQLGG